MKTSLIDIVDFINDSLKPVVTGEYDRKGVAVDKIKSSFRAIEFYDKLLLQEEKDNEIINNFLNLLGRYQDKLED